MAASLLLQRPYWQITNTLNLPVLTDEDGDGTPTIRSLVSLSLPIAIFLDTIFGENNAGRGARNLGEDQLNVFRSIEDSMAAMGIDGRGCLLRLICEMQSNPIGEFTVIGEIITVLFTPKRGLNDFLHDYIEAEIAGSNGDHCPSMYPTCPFSVMNTVTKYRKFMQQYSTADDRPGVLNGIHPHAQIPNNHIDVPRMIFQ